MSSECTDGCQADSYCKTTWIVAGGAVKETGCITTRTDLTDQKCKTNRKGLVSCICNSERCNDASFSIPSDVALAARPTIKCYNNDMNEDNFCFGHYCIFSVESVMNDFGDVYPASYYPTRGCNDDEYNDDLNSVNMCYMTNGYIRCKCDTEFCNKGQPYPVPLGGVLCYFSATDSRDPPPALKYCRGLSVIPYALKTIVFDGAPEETKKPGCYSNFKFCNENLCNGDYTEDVASGNGVTETTTAVTVLETTTLVLNISATS
uniref:ET module n=1 Tax=Caenorhabditis tropicalis TaxID=1561998 RepID=A0A1I7TYE9_9PELO